MMSCRMPLHSVIRVRNTMYKRLSQEDIDRIKHEKQSDRLFLNLNEALAEVGIKLDDITPEEIWSEACGETDKIACALVPVFNVRTMHMSLVQKYRDYSDLAGQIHHRTEDEAKNTAFLVELTVLYQLTVYQRSWENHPYKSYCITIYEHVAQHPQFETILPLITKSNDAYEEVFGTEIPEHDYMPSVVKDSSVIKEALQLTLLCANKYKASGYDDAWFRGLWGAMIESELKGQLRKDLQNESRYTTIYGVIGVLRKAGVLLGTQKDLAQTSPIEKPNKESVRRFISNGTQDTTTAYAKFVIRYVNEYKVK